VSPGRSARGECGFSSPLGLLGPFLGLNEGLAESAARLLKVYSGCFSDRAFSRRPLTVGGYAVLALAKLLLLAASNSWVFVLLPRFADRMGKGVRRATP
jgi:hypothetical protein